MKFTKINILKHLELNTNYILNCKNEKSFVGEIMCLDFFNEFLIINDINESETLIPFSQVVDFYNKAGLK